MYRIMIARSKKENFASLYQYLTVSIDGKVKPLEFETLEALDTYVEEMLAGDYAKSDFIIVKAIDYTIDAKDYTDDEQEEQANEEPAADGEEQNQG